MEGLGARHDIQHDTVAALLVDSQIKRSRLMSVSEQQLTYPSPNPSCTLISYPLTVAGLGEGLGAQLIIY